MALTGCVNPSRGVFESLAACSSARSKMEVLRITANLLALLPNAASEAQKYDIRLHVRPVGQLLVLSTSQLAGQTNVNGIFAEVRRPVTQASAI